MDKMDKIAKCKVDFDGFDWRNIYTVISPTGKSIRFSPNGYWNILSSGLLKKFQEIDSDWKIGKHYVGLGEKRFNVVEFTYSELEEMLKLPQV